jgi:hypothetical protein
MLRNYLALESEPRPSGSGEKIKSATGETACPTIEKDRLALVAQAVSPAVFVFFTPSDARGSDSGAMK